MIGSGIGGRDTKTMEAAEATMEGAEGKEGRNEAINTIRALKERTGRFTWSRPVFFAPKCALLTSLVASG
jgi:hypothetical protein